MTFNAAVIQVLLCAIWGLGQVAIKVVATDISPMFHAGLRSTGACLVLMAWIAWRCPQVYKRDGTLWLGLLIGTLFGLEFVFLFQGLMLTSAARGTLLLYTASFFVAIGAHFLVPNDSLSKRKIAGLLIAFAGVALVVTSRSDLSGAAESIKGDVYCLIASLFWAATTIVVKTTRLKQALPEKILLYQIGFSSGVLLLASMIANEAGISNTSHLLWGVLAYGVFIVASASYLTWFWLISRFKATTLHAFTFLTPLFAIVFGSWLLNEAISPSLLIAAALIAAGIVLVNRS
jgi:drug/metabolite transporter (DMT)-like permease